MLTSIDAGQLNETYLVALCIWREMRGASVPERLGCYWVVKNRSTDKAGRGWPKSMAGVIVQPMQFSSFTVTDANATKWPRPDGTPDWQAWCDIVAMLTAADQVPPDPTSGANSYENCGPNTPRPRWADPAKMTVQLGETRFYKL